MSEVKSYYVPGGGRRAKSTAGRVSRMKKQVPGKSDMSFLDKPMAGSSFAGDPLG